VPKDPDDRLCWLPSVKRFASFRPMSLRKIPSDAGYIDAIGHLALLRKCMGTVHLDRLRRFCSFHLAPSDAGCIAGDLSFGRLMVTSASRLAASDDRSRRMSHR